ncbi:hypothetical protein EI613_12995 [Azospirillum sp. 412522]|nr:hypothetical protein [Azospirillum sp. 412522]
MPADCLNPAAHAATPGGLPPNGLPHWAAEPPEAPEGLVPGSRFHEEQWVMAAGMLARGASFLNVSRAMGCSRTTLWRAYYGAKDFRRRVWWERQALNRESDLRLASLHGLLAEQLERLVSAGDPATIRWLAERLDLFSTLDDNKAPGAAAGPLPGPLPDPVSELAADLAAQPLPDDDPNDDPGIAAVAATAAAVVADDDDSVPGAFRERTLPDPRAVAAILAQPEAEGPKGVYPWTLNPDDPYPNLGSAQERRGDKGAFGR